ncbi:MAG TPA: GspE/PulE family protein [Candidatus Paceibacterota bacterium]|nr:GspE/PulE family protein [Candidatus Paceibacterota bacterium]HPT17992.1 GspE/PulE family protein [Candidatus Paceibacterota bacterium]
MTDFDEEKQQKQLEELRKQEEEQLVQVLAESKYGLPYVDMSRLGIDNESLRAISEKDARDLKVGPFKLSGKNIYIAILSPSEDLLSKLKEEMARKDLTPLFYMASHYSVNKIWERYKEISMAESSKVGGIEISSEILRDTAKNIEKMQDIEKLIKEAMEGSQTHKVSHILEIILAGAISIKASDIHIEAEKDMSRLRLRLDGVLQDVMFFEHDIYHLLNSRIKLLSGMKLTSVVAQDGRFSIAEGAEEISIRSSMIPGAYGESIVMRILDPKSIQVNLEEIGIEPFLFSIIQEEITKPNGLILITGPTGSGKTTTLYAFLRKIYSTEIKIITIEDPIEYHLPGITQTQTNEEKGYTFLEGLRSALRQDPDVVMVGEIRDAETAKIAIESALTGHMVFSTLHTNNAAGVIPRLIDLEANPKIMVSALSLSIAQRLVRKLCQFCKKEKIPDEKEVTTMKNVIDSIKEEGKDLSKYNIDPNAPFKIYMPVGCEKCNMTGFKGRIGIFEAIKTDEAIEKIIPQNPSEREIKRIAKNQGILSMRQDGMVKIINGITSFEEVQSVVDLTEE